MRHLGALGLAASALLATAGAPAATSPSDPVAPRASAAGAASLADASPTDTPTGTPTGTTTPAPSPDAQPTTVPSDAPTGSPTPNPTPSATQSPTATVAPAQATTDACGARPVKADGQLWSCTFADDFEGTTLDRDAWMPQTNVVSGIKAAHACYLDDPDNVSVSGGDLHLTVRQEDSPVPCVNKSLGDTSSYSAGSVMTYHRFSQQYGRFEVRMKSAPASVPGLQETFWLWPDDRVQSDVTWPAAGEIDVAELYSQYPHLVIPFLHYTAYDNGGPYPGLNTAWNCAAERGVFNTYTLLWSADRLEIDVNGKVCLVNTSGDPAFQKPYIIALSALLGTAANALTSSTPLPATLDVDYVRVWR
jgi:beta-glucanase (GH16 family)